MNTPRHHLSFALLSDLQRRPAALHCIPTGLAEPEDTHWPDLSSLGAAVPCVMLAQDVSALSPVRQEQWRAAGGRSLAAEALAAWPGPDAPVPSTALYLSGDWYLQTLAKPGAKPTGSRALALKLVQLIATDADTWELEEVFRLEPTLTYNLLRLVNSAGMSQGRRIDSLAQAILFLGRRQLKRWMNLMLFASQKEDPRSAMLLARAAVRARTCELLAKAIGLDKDGQESAFLVGMFSLLGTMFNLPLPELIQPLHLDDDMSQALLAQTGDLGQILVCSQAFEQRDLALTQSLTARLRPAVHDIDPLLIDAHLWMLGLISPQGENAHG